MTLAGRSHLNPILDAVSLNIPARTRLGILANPGSGKTTLARLFSGLERPSNGKINIQGKVSWPLGFAGFFHPELTIAENAALIAQLQGRLSHRYLATCLEFAEIDIDPNAKTHRLTPSERAKFAYACAICLPWDMLIADETLTVGEARMRSKCNAILESKKANTGLIFLSRNINQLRLHCDHHLLLIGGKLKPCPDLEAGKEALALFDRKRKEALETCLAQ